MKIKMALLGALTLVVAFAGAQNKTYTVRQGDTISDLSKRFQVRASELAAVNSLDNSHRLRVGMTLRIPARRPGSAAVKPVAGRTYAVRNGDSDWTIARRNGLTVPQLHALNPAVNFRNLQIGTKVYLPGGATKSQPAPKVAAKSAPAVSSAPTSTRAYIVKAGDNDWALARRLDTRVKVLRALNPGVDLSKMRPGQSIRIPNGVAASAPATVAKAPAKPSAAPAAPKASALRGKYAEVNVDAGIIRRGASTNAGKVTTVDKGTRVVVLDQQDGWYKLRFPKGTVGWMRGDLLKSVKASDVARERVAAAKPKPEVRAPRVVAQAPRPETRTPEVQRPAAPARPKAPVRTASVRSRPVVSTKGAGSVASGTLLSTAKSQLGIRYRWGGTSRSGFDCSGFVQYVYKKNGVSLPRTSREMANSGRYVSRSSLKAGDLVLFQTRRSARVSHVGMYIGNGKFIHASSGGGRVRIDSLNSGYYSRRLVTTRRVMSDAKAKQVVREASKAVIEAPKVDEPVNVPTSEPEEQAPQNP